MCSTSFLLQVRRSIVRQRVLRKCLEMRKRKIHTRDPSLRFGQYGGKPLWAMSRDIDRVIADNHPKIRRMKRVQEVMRRSLESGAILDDAAVSRRIETFFQLQQGRKQMKEKSPERPKDVFQSQSFTQRRNVFKLPPMSGSIGGGDASQKPSSEPVQSTSASQRRAASEDNPPTGAESQPKERVDGRDRRRSSEGVTVAVADAVSLNVDLKGRLRGIRTRSIDTIHEGEDSGEEKDEERSVENGTEGEAGEDSRSSGAGKDKERSRGVSGGEGEENAGVRADPKNKQYRADSDKRKSRPRSKLILPPIESSKALVTRT